MQSRREFLGFLPAGLLGATATLQAQPEQRPAGTLLTLSPPLSVYRPLDEVPVHGAGRGRLLVLEGEGEPYFDQDVTLPVSFRPGGALGTHTVLLMDADHKLDGHASLAVDVQTGIRAPS